MIFSIQEERTQCADTPPFPSAPYDGVGDGILVVDVGVLADVNNGGARQNRHCLEF